MWEENETQTEQESAGHHSLYVSKVQNKKKYSLTWALESRLNWKNRWQGRDRDETTHGTQAERSLRVKNENKTETDQWTADDRKLVNVHLFLHVRRASDRFDMKIHFSFTPSHV